jgi:hypothetical protein
MTTAVADPDN